MANEEEEGVGKVLCSSKVYDKVLSNFTISDGEEWFLS